MLKFRPLTELYDNLNINSWIEVLERVRAQYGNITIDVDCDSCDSSSGVNFCTFSEETPEEIVQRKLEEKQHLERIELEERNNLKRLKAKYETGN